MLALIAGQGGLPAAIVQNLTVRPFVAALEGFLPENDLSVDLVFRLETLGSAIATLLKAGVTEVCFAGSIRRVPIDPSKIDAATMPLVPRIAAALHAGDASALRIALSLFEEAGLSVRGAHEVLPMLLPNAGCLTTVTPSDLDLKDAVRGAEIVALLAAGDIGQACVVSAGQAVAIEAMPGTDWMLRSLQTVEFTGGILFKAPKPGQDRRADLPTIGPDTFRRAGDIGLNGIVIEAQGVMVLELDKCLEIAKDRGLFLLVRKGEA